MSELNKQLLAKTSGNACDENIIVCNNVRVTVLTERMLRVEFSTNGVRYGKIFRQKSVLNYVR